METTQTKSNGAFKNVLVNITMVLLCLMATSYLRTSEVEPRIEQWRYERVEAKFDALLDAGDYEGAFCVAYPDHCTDDHLSDDWMSDRGHISVPGSAPFYYLGQ